MKKSVLLSAVTLALASSTAFAQTEVVEVYESVSQIGEVDQWVGDCTQGRLINKNKDNWFITAEGGANILFGRGDIHAAIKDRIDGAGALYLGKWVTPTFGFRFGVNYIMTKGATRYGGEFIKWNDASQLVKGDEVQKGWYSQKWMGLGPEFDVMVNLTNWWCGYRPGRVYNAVVHGGAGAYWRWAYNKRGAQVDGFYPDSHWHGAHNTILFATLGLQNNFRLSKHVDFFIDLQYQMIDEPRLEHGADVYLGFNFNLGKTDWNCPVVPVCADVSGYKTKIANLEGDINDLRRKNKQLQDQLEDCVNSKKNATNGKTSVIKVGDKEISQASLVTIYYPINQYDLSSREQKVLKSVADVMMANPEQTYELIGWADNWTGSADYNQNLRWNRVNGVKDYLISCGVNPAQLDVSINDENLVEYEYFKAFEAEKVRELGAPLDRAVTIHVID